MNIFNLPVPDNKPISAKRMISKPNIRLMTEEQVKAFERLHEFFNSNEQYIRINGKAGVGKTYVMSMFIEDLLIYNNNIKVCMCAPTNKAVRVMNDMASYVNSRIEYKTAHSLMGIKLKKQDGKEIFIQDGPVKINSYDIIVWDEASMTPHELFELTLQHNEVKVIFVGDINQLPPVVNDEDRVYWRNKGWDPDESPVWQMEMPEIKMVNIVRQAQGNPIIKLADFTTNQVYYPQEQYDVKVIDENVEYPRGIFQFNKKVDDDFEMFSDLMIHYFTSENYKEDANFCKVLCFTNKMVDRYNNNIRYYYFGEDPDLGKITKGERLVVSDGIKDLEYKPLKKGDEKLLFNVNDEIEVLSYSEEVFDVADTELRYYEALVMNINTPHRDPVCINIIHESSEAQLAKVLSSIAEAAWASRKGSRDRHDMWKAFYQIKDFFANVAYGYALTVHKSQGSTYNNVIYDMFDIKYARKEKFKQQLQYTAITRAKDRLFIVY